MGGRWILAFAAIDYAGFAFAQGIVRPAPCKWRKDRSCRASSASTAEHSSPSNQAEAHPDAHPAKQA